VVALVIVRWSPAPATTVKVAVSSIRPGRVGSQCDRAGEDTGDRVRRNAVDRRQRAEAADGAGAGRFW